MEYKIDANDAEAVVAVRGRLTFNDHAKLRSLIQEMLQIKAKRQIVDLSNLEFVDSAGIGMLLIAREELTTAEKTFILRSPQGQVKRVLSVAQLGKIVNIEE
mgnify:CR=1 FL=1